jgi:flagellum-specific peptidoglycan hydrolase FlgJ
MAIKKILISITLILCSLEIGQIQINTQTRNQFSESSMINLAKSLGVKYIDIMVAQARIETGWYTSKIFIHNNNIFGMKLPERRLTTAIGSDRGHAQYISWQQSVADYKIWQSKVLIKNKSRRKYLSYIGRTYAENGNYINLIKKQL